MKLLNHHYALLLYRHLGAFAAVGLTVVLLRLLPSLLPIQITLLIFLLPVMVSTVLWGLSAGVLAAFVAFLAFNYYYIQPYHTFAVHATQDLISLIIFLIVAVLISQLIGKAREGMRLASSREREATRMYRLISALAGLQDHRSIADALARHTLEAFECYHVQVSVASHENAEAVLIDIPDSGDAGEPPTHEIVLKTARSTEGLLSIWRDWANVSLEEMRLLEAFANQGALALERVRLAAGENKARVLEESDRLKTSLLNSVSHELRSPLSAIKASVSSLRSGAVDWNAADRGELLATIEEETDDLNLLVGHLLDMSRIESGALQPNLSWNSIEEIVMGMAMKMRKQIADHQLEIDLPAGLPLVPSDYVMLGQVITNLFSNSAKYAPAGTLISVKGRVEGDNLHVEVANRGPQVPEEHLERIFEKFYRATETDRVTGTGLGLSICKGIIEAHGGRIWASNQPPCFVFHFTLPLKLRGALPEIPREAGDG